MIYCYVCKSCGKKAEYSKSLSEFTSSMPCECGGAMGIDLVEQHKNFRNTPGAWPMESDAAGVHPDQARELAEYVASRGVPTEINAETGNPLFHSREHRKKFCQVTNLYDRNAGIGDATPKHNMKRRDPNKQKQRRGALLRALTGASNKQNV